ncbi:MAG: acyl-CoA dehydrogenase [Verrucomicrobia bacterium]|nr:MAG: acyl-CoA dehydrogenase [Verrucomicrobiota bacterium]PYL82254.1 MAG: acyl-CoA dehydrogenase [Verrucomicrobiota bacterium]PYL93111.1 MAG: acyl-CoA dehydrogenase [Verrucomicrobiota bacterium]
MAQSEAEIQRQKEMQQAEELLFSGRQELGFAKGLFLGNFVADWVMPYPRLDATRQTELDSALIEVRQMLDRDLDPDWIDRNADIPRNLIDGLARTGVLGMTAAREFGGRGFSQMQCCRILEEIGKRDASTSVFVNAHHSIGIRALLLFGTREQQAQWLPALVAGEKLAAFALTEREAGSDAANVRMTAKPSDDSSHYVLNGEKRYITNAGIAQVWTVMARTPVSNKPGKDAITAFLVTPDMPGVEMIEARMPKLGIRGTATGRFRLNNVRVPKENILGPLGKGLRVALTVLDFGRTTFGACCTGAAKHCLQLAIEHANSRQQFKKTLGNFDLVKKKIARMAADIYAMEAMTNVTASLIDRGLEDYMIETAMLKVFTTERLWEAVNDAFQIHGGSAYFDDNPLGRILRDARINQIGEGSNEVLTSFIALVGMRGPGMEFKEIYDTMTSFSINRVGKAWSAGMSRLGATVRTPNVPVQSVELRAFAGHLGRLIWRFNVAVNRALVVYREPVLDMQLIQERIAGAAMELFASTCTLSRWDSELQASQRNGNAASSDSSAPGLFLRQSFRRIRTFLDSSGNNDDKAILATADSVLGKTR